MVIDASSQSSLAFSARRKVGGLSFSSIFGYDERDLTATVVDRGGLHLVTNPLYILILHIFLKFWGGRRR